MTIVMPADFFSDPLGARNRFFETLSPSLRLKEPLGESL